MDIIATLGPSRLTSSRINSFIDEGVTIFRVNGAHTDAHMAASIVEEVRRFAGRPRPNHGGPPHKQDPRDEHQRAHRLRRG